jgi:hypothetical protein
MELGYRSPYLPHASVQQDLLPSAEADAEGP